MGAKAQGCGGDPPSTGCVKPIFNEGPWQQRKSLLESLHNTVFLVGVWRRRYMATRIYGGEGIWHRRCMVADAHGGGGDPPFVG